jgi:hypothetical protein
MTADGRMRRCPTREEKEIREQTQLLRAWLQWHRDDCKAALSGPHAHMVERLLFILKELQPSSQPLLLGYIRGIDWTAIDEATRRTLLHEISDAIIRLRTRSGLEPFDDGPPGDRLPVFLTIKSIFFPADDAGANRGAARLCEQRHP